MGSKDGSVQNIQGFLQEMQQSKKQIQWKEMHKSTIGKLLPVVVPEKLRLQHYPLAEIASHNINDYPESTWNVPWLYCTGQPSLSSLTGPVQ